MYSQWRTLFRHALAQVKFEFKIDDASDENYSVYITGFELDNIYTVGDLVLTLDGNDDKTDFMQGWILPVDGTYNVWSDLTKEDDPFLTIQTPNTTTAVSTTEACYSDADGKSTDFFYVIPQTLVPEEKDQDQTVIAGQRMVVDFDLYVKTTTTDNSGEPVSTEAKVDSYKWTTYLNNSELKAWEINKKITYTVVFAPPFNEITFDPAVVDWSSADQTITFD